MPTNSIPYSILVGVGDLWAAPVGTAFPDVDAVPAAAWINLGQTDGGVIAALEQTLEQHRTDQVTGPLKATRTEENLKIETNLAEATLENMARLLTEAVVDTPPGGATIGTRALNLYRGFTVNEYAFLFRGQSPYGPWPQQMQIPRGYFDGELAAAFVKEGKVLFPVSFVALEDQDAASEADRFGKVVAQDAVATG